MALSVIVLLLWDARRTAYRVGRWVLVALAVALLLLSSSITSLLVSLVVILLIPLYRSLRCHFDFRIFVVCFYIVAAFLTAIWACAESKTVLDLFHRDLTFTGRIDLWEVVVEMIERRPFLGYGYNGFWLGAKGASATVWRLVGWQTPHAHNGLLDLWLNLGFLGVALFLAGFFRAVHGAARLVRASTGALALWPLVYLTFFSLANLTESALARHNSIFWVLYVAAVFSCRQSAVAGGEPEVAVRKIRWPQSCA